MDKENNVGNYLRFCHHSSEYQASPWGETSWTMTLNVRTVNVIPIMVPYFALLWDSTFIRVLFLRFYVSHGKSFLPSSRAHSLKIKEKTPDPRLGYLTPYLGIVACPQGLSRFSKKYWGETVFRDTQREKNNCHRNTQISSVGHFRTSHPLEFPSQWSLSYPAAPPPPNPWNFRDFFREWSRYPSRVPWDTQNTKAVWEEIPKSKWHRHFGKREDPVNEVVPAVLVNLRKSR